MTSSCSSRVTVTIWDRKSPYFFSKVRGRVVEVVTGPQPRANIDALAQKYLGADYPMNGSTWSELSSKSGLTAKMCSPAESTTFSAKSPPERSR